MNSFELFLKDEVADASLLMNLIDSLLELIKQFLLLTLQVLVLLEADFVLPFDIL